MTSDLDHLIQERPYRNERPHPQPASTASWDDKLIGAISDLDRDDVAATSLARSAFRREDGSMISPGIRPDGFSIMSRPSGRTSRSFPGTPSNGPYERMTEPFPNAGTQFPCGTGPQRECGSNKSNP